MRPRLTYLLQATGMWATNIPIKIQEIIKFITRGMAVCLVLMMGRLGGVIGTNTVAIFLDSHCELSFFVGSAFMFGNLEDAKGYCNF